MLSALYFLSDEWLQSFSFKRRASKSKLFSLYFFFIAVEMAARNFLLNLFISVVCAKSLQWSDQGYLHAQKKVLDNRDVEIASAPFRLPTAVVPIHYKIFLETNIHDPNQSDFDGNVRFHVRALQATSEIVLHSRQLSIHRIRVFELDGTLIHFDVPWSYNWNLEFLQLQLPSPLQTGQEVFIDIPFTGTTRDLLGFVRNFYVDDCQKCSMHVTSCHALMSQHSVLYLN